MIYLPHAVPKRNEMRRGEAGRGTQRNATKWSHQKRLTSLRKNGNDNDHDDDVADNDDDDDGADDDGDGKWNAVCWPCAPRNAVLICVQGWETAAVVAAAADPWRSHREM